MSRFAISLVLLSIGCSSVITVDERGSNVPIIGLIPADDGVIPAGELSVSAQGGSFSLMQFDAELDTGGAPIWLCATSHCVTCDWSDLCSNGPIQDQYIFTFSFDYQDGDSLSCEVRGVAARLDLGSQACGVPDKHIAKMEEECEPLCT